MSAELPEVDLERVLEMCRSVIDGQPMLDLTEDEVRYFYLAPPSPGSPLDSLPQIGDEALRRITASRAQSVHLELPLDMAVVMIGAMSVGLITLLPNAAIEHTSALISALRLLKNNSMMLPNLRDRILQYLQPQSEAIRAAYKDLCTCQQCLEDYAKTLP